MMWEKLRGLFLPARPLYLHHPCCGKKIGGPCPYCAGRIPQQIQLTIAGVADGDGCTKCDENLNNTFVLDWYVGCLKSNICVWTYDFGTTLEDCPPLGNYARYLSFALGLAGPLYVYLSDYPCSMPFGLSFVGQLSGTPPFECKTINESMDPSYDILCDYTGATCTAVAL